LRASGIPKLGPSVPGTFYLLALALAIVTMLART
jgi:hypothetical protein